MGKTETLDIRKALENSRPPKDPVARMMIDWYQTLDEHQKNILVQMIHQTIIIIQANTQQPIGPLTALEIIAPYIAIKCGWGWHGVCFNN